MGYKFNPFTGNLDEVGAGGAGSSPGGADTQIQFNDAGSFGGDVDLTWNKTTNVMTVGGDINLDDGIAGPVTTLQTITPTANRTISFPDATGTVGLVAGSSGQLVYNNAGAYAGASGSSVGASGDITLSANGAASTGTGSAFKLTGSWYTGADPVPQALIQPAGTATSTTWSTSGTGLGVNAASGFTGNLLDLQVDGTSLARFSSTGALSVPSGSASQAGIRFGAANEGFYKTTLGFAFSIPTNTPVFAARYVNPAQFNWGLGLVRAAFIGWGSQFDATTGHDLYLGRDDANTLAQRNGANAQTYRLYNTYTDASNYERGFVRWNSNQFEVGTEAAGTGNNFRQLAFYSQGGQRMVLGSDTSVITSKLNVYGYFVSNGSGGWKLAFGSSNSANTTSFGVLTDTRFASTANGQFVWTAANYGANQSTPTVDTGIARDSAGVVALTDGSTGTGYLKQAPVAVSALPAAATVGAGTRGFVSDSTVAASGNFGATVTGGGSNNVPVFSDGTNWLIG